MQAYPLGLIEPEVDELNLVKIRGTGEQSIPNSVSTVVQFDAIEIAEGSAIAPPILTAGVGNDTITVLQNGIYLLEYTGDWDPAASGFVVLEPFVNGLSPGPPVFLMFKPATAGQSVFGKAIVLRLKVNDTIQLKAIQGTGAPLELEEATLTVWQLHRE